MQLQFNKKNIFGASIFTSSQTDKVSLVQGTDSRFYVRMNCDGSWMYPEWQFDGFESQCDAESYLSMLDLDSTDFEKAEFDPDELGFTYQLIGLLYDPDTDKYTFSSDDDTDMEIECDPLNPLCVCYSENGETECQEYDSFDDLIEDVEQTILSCNHRIFSKRVPVTAAINVRNLASQLFRVKSSNIWAYRLFMRDRHDKTGDLIVQFKDKNGGAGHVYIYYDVPFMIFRNWQATQSKGHYFWKHIRPYFKYSKLTGDKIGKLKNAVNHYEHTIVDPSEANVDQTPTCRYMLDYVNDFISGKINRDEFTQDLKQYYDIGRTDMLDENRRFASDFQSLIINVVNKHSDYGDDRLKRTLARNVRQLANLIDVD